MKQVLFISYDFPPCTAPGAAVRTAKFAKYLPEFGWQATVLCRREPGVNTEQEPETVRRIRSLLSTDWSYQLNAWAWALTLRCGKVRQVRDPSFDLVVVSCPPFPPGLAALHLRGLLGVPLVVDFRDA